MEQNILEGDVEDLKIKSIIGFDGTTIDGLRIHPGREHLIYPLGNKVTILNWETKKQEFLTGHTNNISAIDVSSTGKYIASGQINHIGFKAMVIVWLFEERTVYLKHEVHKVRIEAVAFTRTDKYLISLGGRDDSNVVVWDLENSKPLCCAPASKGIQGEATVVKVTSRREQCFVTAGDGTLTVWKIDSFARKLFGIDVKTSKLKRCIICAAIDDKDEIMYCGTITGDIMKIKLNYHHNSEILDPTAIPIMYGCYAKINRRGQLPLDMIELFGNGVRALLILDKKLLLVGSGNGDVHIVQETVNALKHTPLNVKLPSTPELEVVKFTNVRSMVTTLILKNRLTVLVGTVDCEMYEIDLRTFERKLLITCHTSTIYSLAFPYRFSKIFATSSKNDVRIWNIETMQEMLRIKVENFCCSGVVFQHNGKGIITGWNDGIIRAFTPITGKLMFSILNAHNKGVSAIALTEDDRMIISGGCEGQVRVWDISPYRQTLSCTLKEHKAPVSAIHINKFNDEAVSASTDGTCIIWDIVRKCRKQILFANTLFMCVKYFPTAVQILSVGSDRKIAYWEVYDGTLIRELEGSRSAGLNALDISPDGSMFCTGGNDQLIKLWKYEEGIITHIGVGHSAVITAISFSPNGKYIVSTSASGSIFVWECPFDVAKGMIDIDEEQTKHKGDEEKNDENIHNVGSKNGEKKKNGKKEKKFECKCGKKKCVCAEKKK